jgi:hypothetical protein
MLKDATVLLIRHGEKPGNPGIDRVEDGTDLSQPGRERAHAYVAFFQPYSATEAGTGKAHTKIEPDGLFAAKDSHMSHRPRLTLEPLAVNRGLDLNCDYEDDKLKELIKALETTPARNILVCWHHGKLIELANMLLKKSERSPFPPEWPAKVFGWTIQVRYDKKGDVERNWTTCSSQKLMFDDTVEPLGIGS